MEDWIIGVILALFIIVPCWLALVRRQETIRQVKAWPELARRTGLAYKPAARLWESWVSPVSPPGVRGEFRGYSISLDLVIDSDHNPVFQNTSISLHVENPACLFLSIQEREFRDYIRRVTDVASRDLGFDRLFSAMGSPREFVQRALALIVQCEPRLFAWIMRKLPSLELKGDNLTCWQNGELTDVDDQIALLNLLCDLAELVERGEAESARPVERRI